MRARSLPPLAQQNLRYQAVRAVHNGMKLVEVAGMLGITRQAVSNWVKAHRTGGPQALKARAQGRPRQRILPVQGQLHTGAHEA